MTQFDWSRLAGSLLVALDVATGNRGAELVAVVVLLIAAITATGLVHADRIAARLLHTRARRLPDDMAERLLEEWLAEAARMSRAGKIAFAVSLLLTRTSALVQGGSREDADELARAVASGERAFVAAGLFKRFLALLVDFAFWSTIAMLPLLLFSAVIPSMLFDFLLYSAAVTACEVWLVVRYGGNVGKLAMQLRVIAVDGPTVTLRHALGRALPTVFVGILPPIAATATVLWSGTDSEAFLAMTPGAQEVLLRTLAPGGLMSTVEIVFTLWFLADALAAYHHPDHRSLHDRIGGTMVVYRDPRIVGRRPTRIRTIS